MKLNTIPGGGVNISVISSILNPNFKGIPDARSLAKYVIRSLIEIKKNNLQIKIYLSQDVTNKIGNILLSMGVKFKTIPVTKMEAPYIFLTVDDNYIVIKTANADGRELATYKAPFSKFVEAIESFFSSYKSKKAKKKENQMKHVDEVIISSDDLKKFLEKYKFIFGEDDI